MENNLINLIKTWTKSYRPHKSYPHVTRYDNLDYVCPYYEVCEIFTIGFGCIFVKTYGAYIKRYFIQVQYIKFFF